ncbi:hypothetical protein GCM10011324_35590 [Allosediminivita pacifica]|nr:hypothetical protein GCM10011324_35590 [Allosediminivita pacifica]
MWPRTTSKGRSPTLVAKKNAPTEGGAFRSVRPAFRRLAPEEKQSKRRVKAKLREDRGEAAGPNDVWAMDFVHDQLAMGKKLRILTVVDTHSRFCPVVDPRFSYRGEDVVQTLEHVCGRIGYPNTIRVDNVLCRENLAA